MPREKECYRDNLAALLEAFPGRQTINLVQAAQYLSTRPERLRSDKNFPMKKLAGQYIVSLVSFANWLS